MKNVKFLGSAYYHIIPLFIGIIGILTIFTQFTRFIKTISKNAISFNANQIDKDKMKKGEILIIKEWDYYKRR